MLSRSQASSDRDTVSERTPKLGAAFLVAGASAAVIFGGHRAGVCGANVPGQRSAIYWLIALCAGVAVALAAVLVLRGRSAGARVASATSLGLLAGTAAYIYEALSWVGHCG